MRPRVCFVTCEFHPDIGGVGKSARRITRFLADGYDIDLITHTPSVAQGEVSSSIEHGIRVHRVGRMPDDLSNMAAIRLVIERLDKRSPFDIFHGFFLPCAKPCLEVSNGRPVVASIRGNDAVSMRENPDWVDHIDRIVEDAAWVTTVASDLLLRFDRGRSRRDECSLLFNSIDLTRHEVRWSAASNQGVVGTLANLRKKKNLPLLLEGYARIPPALRSGLFIAGGFQQEPDLKERLLRRAEALQLSAELTLFGGVPPREVPPVFGKMYVYGFTSDHDGMPNTLLEAAAAGVPIVATAVGAVPDIMTHDVDGLLVPPREPDALASALSRVLSDIALARRLSVAARGLAERFDYSAEKGQWLDLYHRILHTRPGRTAPQADSGLNGSFEAA